MPRCILDPGRHVWRTRPVDEFGLLVDANDYYREFYRAALRARRYILLSGWQFDSDVELLRGPEAEEAQAPVQLLKFLDHLCHATPDLRIYILAWDFHMVFAIEREWMQKLVFHWTTHPNLQFRFDSSHAPGGSHHQKFVVIDGELAFLGGIDVCDHRWDDREHKNKNPLRMSRGEPHKPFHDIQAFLRGRELSDSLRELFLARWQRSGGEAITLLDSQSSLHAEHRIGDLLPLAARNVSLSRTDPHGSPDGPAPCTEIRDLFVDAIQSAERLLYIETQYFSSHRAGAALEQRMRARDRPRLEIVVILNMEAETFKEQAAVGLSQAKIIEQLRATAAETGHALGLYYTLPGCDGEEKPERATYIHSKLMIVDDRLLTLGSANLTNRSMSLDTELNVTLETLDVSDELGQSIRKARALLLAEHSGGPDVEQVEGLVAHLNLLADRAVQPEPRAEQLPCRLRHHPSPTEGEKRALAIIDPQQLPFDPDLIENLDQHTSIFVGGFGAALRKLLHLDKSTE
jgi:phospholipase D1/2